MSDDGDEVEETTQIIETGDSVKVKQVLDDATMEAVVEAGYDHNYEWENIKLALMLLSCLFAVTAQFYPMPFPQSRPLLGICCISYFILSSVLQFMVSYIDKDMIMYTKQKPDSEDPPLVIRTSFPRFQETFTLIIQYKKPNSPETTGRMYVGKYFTQKGEYDKVGFMKDVKKHVQRFQQKKYMEFHYNHKSD
mmetsp:Transcript_5605/g.5800  ORF Transcript_5605/g.5800 Transcript_5605/m.5800 type:complete len:193 (-) Transcript_5605:191-769(-)